MSLLRPSEIRFTQDSISEQFGRDEPYTIENTFEELLYGEKDIKILRSLSVVRKDGLIWVISGNRRLYVYKKLEKYGRITTIDVNYRPLNEERFSQMKTTKNEGQSIYIRQDRKRSHGDKLENRIERIYQKWVREGRPTSGRLNIMAGDWSSRRSPEPVPWRSSEPVQSYTYPTTRSTFPSSSSFNSQRASVSSSSASDRAAAATNKSNDSWCTIL